jgi:MFS family permease
VPAAADATREELFRRSVRVLVVSQVLGGLGLAAGVTVGALLAEDMLDSTRLSGLPAALFTIGSAIAALLVGRLSDRSGRRVGLASGYFAGALGSAAVVVAAWLNSPALLLAALVVYGSGFATNLQARYAGTDLAPEERRGRAVSIVLVATTLGAVLGPNLTDPTGTLAGGLGLPELAGPFLLAAVAWAAAGTVLALALRPDPLLAARRLAAQDAAPAADCAPVPASTGAPVAGLVRLGAAAMVLSQLVMTAVMTMTPIHMRDHGHGLGATGVVIAVHIGAMYLPSPLTGTLVDRVGRRPVIAAAGVVLLAAGLVAAAAPDDSVALLAVALGLLGLGWNLGLIGGTTLVTDGTPLAARARTQGSVDVAVALAGAAGGISSGVVVASTSYAALALAGGLTALALLPLLLRAPRLTPRPA